MDPAKREAMCARIMKLLELGDDERNSNPNERQNALELAAKLMLEHALEFTDLYESTPKDKLFVQVDVPGMAGDHKLLWESVLAGRIAVAFDVQVVNCQGMFGQPFKVAFLGTKSDTDITVFFFTYLRRTVGVMGRRSFPKQVKVQENYCLGLVLTLGERLAQMFAKREEFMSSDSRALMVVKKDGLEEFVKTQFPRLSKSRNIQIKGDIKAFNKGKADGHTVNLRTPIAGEATKPLAAIG